MSTIFVFTAKTTQPRPQVFSVNSALTSIGLLNQKKTKKFFEIWSLVAGYGELCACF